MNSRIGVGILVLLIIVGAGGVGYVVLTQPKAQKPSTQSSPATSTSPVPLAALASPESSPTSSATPVATRTFRDTQSLAQPNMVETIPLGGSLATIAQSHDVTVQDLTRLNNIADPNKITANQTLIIPDVASGDTYVILYILNTQRLKREQNQLSAGGTSVYTDPVTAAQSDIKGIFGLKADTPFSKSNETDKTVTLSTTQDTLIATIDLEKAADSIWAVKKVTIKLTPGQAVQ